MATAATPPSIEIWENDRQLLDPDLDLTYIDATADELSKSLNLGVPTEVAYQPGDGTCYRLVFVPLRTLRSVPGRVVDGRIWNRHAIAGMKKPGANDDAPTGFYEDNGYLISWVDDACYPMRLGNRTADLSYDYVAEKWRNAGGVGAVSLALLFRAISYHLDVRTDGGSHL